MIMRLLNWQGIAGVAVAGVLLVMLTVQKIETVHWKKQSESFEHLYEQAQAAFATTVANARAAADQARAADQANAARVATEQRSITERTMNDFEARLAAARADAHRLRLDTEAAGDPRARRSASVPGVPAAASGSPQAAGENRLPQPDQLTATEQAIQLDELIKWIRKQAKVDNNPKAVARPPGD
jgi:acyl-CoA synthetase (AMP-forming)/AMP-acid ligase II